MPDAIHSSLEDVIHDDAKLINWLRRLFEQVSDAKESVVPNGDEIAGKIGRGRQLTPNPDLPMHPPLRSQVPDDPELASWLMVAAINHCMREDGPVPIGIDLWYWATCARAYLGMSQDNFGKD